MSGAKHTPGPWNLEISRSKLDGVNVTFAIQADAVGRVNVCHGQSQEHLEDRGIGEIECAANARLMVAAPELLEALRGMIEAYDDGVTNWEMPYQQAARAAIAKATGESHE